MKKLVLFYLVCFIFGLGLAHCTLGWAGEYTVTLTDEQEKGLAAVAAKEGVAPRDYLQSMVTFTTNNWFTALRQEKANEVSKTYIETGKFDLSTVDSKEITISKEKMDELSK